MKIIRLDSWDAQEPFFAALMPDSAVRPHRRPLFLPPGKFECQIRAAVRINRLGKAIDEKFAHRYYAESALVNYLKNTDDDSMASQIADDTLVLGEWIPILDIPDECNRPAEISVDFEKLNKIIHCLSQKATFKTGDIIVLPDILYSYEPYINQVVKIVTPDGLRLLDFTVK